MTKAKPKAKGKAIPKKKAPKRAMPKVAPKAKQKPAPPAPAKKARKPRKKVESVAGKIDWNAVRMRFVCGVLLPGVESESTRAWPSLSEVAAEFKVSTSATQQKSAAEDWTGQRAAFQDQLHAEEDKRLLKREADNRVKRAVRQIHVSDGLVTEVAISLRQTANLRRVKPDLVMPSIELQRLASAARGAQALGEVAQGKPADGPSVNVDWTVFSAPPAPELPRVITLEESGDEIGGVVTTRRGA